MLGTIKGTVAILGTVFMVLSTTMSALAASEHTYKLYSRKHMYTTEYTHEYDVGKYCKVTRKYYDDTYRCVDCGDTWIKSSFEEEHSYAPHN